MRLNARHLSSLPSTIHRPAYDRSRVTPGIVHLGVGAFHRAHQAVAIDDRLAAGEADWGVIAASLRSPATRDALEPQDGLYTLAVKGESGAALRVIGSINELIVAPEARERLLAAMSDPRIRIVSTTVTEKGYCRDPASGDLNQAHPDILHDLASPKASISAPGLIVEALRRRRAASVAPFALLCCDNLPSNGKTLQRILTQLAGLMDPDMARFIEHEVDCPSTMVDRIVPATTDKDRAEIATALGAEDAWPVMTEPFFQWVIEDRFRQGRPRLEESGCELVSDVAPYEKMKLRLLNGSHSLMAYLGQLAGYQTIAETIADRHFASLVRGLMDHETGPTVAGFSNEALHGYKDALIARFANPSLHHLTRQIAMDGSQKIPQRWMAPVRERLAAGQPIDRLAFAIAAFCRFMTGMSEEGAALPISDPLSARFLDMARVAGADRTPRLSDPDAAAALASRLAGIMLLIDDVFGETGRDPRLQAAVSAALARLYLHGAARVVREMAAGT